MGSIYLRKYGVATTVDFCLYELDGTDLQTAAASATGDVNLIRDEAAPEQLDANAFVNEGVVYSLALSAAEMTAARVTVYIVDQSSPKIWLDKVLLIETYGHASGQHAFDLGTATQDVNVASISNIDFSATMKTSLDTIGDTVVTNSTIHTDLGTVSSNLSNLMSDVGDASASTLGNIYAILGNPAANSVKTTIENIHDTDLPLVKTDTAAILVDSNELQTDWTNDGRLDLLLDSAISKIDAVDDYIDTEVAAIKAVTDTLSLATIADAVLDEVTETGITLRKAMNIALAALAGKSSGGGTATIKFRDQADGKDRISATVDANGNRTAITNDGA